MPTTIEEKKIDRQAGLTPDEARAIAKEAYIYGFPLVDSYRIQYSFFVDKKSPEYKTEWNTLYNTAQVCTPDDKTVQTPNSDTPYSFFGADLRAEPLVLTVPDIEKDRYYSVQFIDMYTFNFGYVGSRATGNLGASYLLAGPEWNGDKPEGVKEIIRCETEFALVVFRTQLFNSADIDNVKKVQAGYKLQTLSQFMGQTESAAAKKIDFITPINTSKDRNSLEFFKVLNFILQFCPTHDSEKSLMDRFAKLGIIAGEDFDTENINPVIKTAIQEGMMEAWMVYDEVKKLANEHKISSADVFGTREYMTNNYAYRFQAAKDGIYGNSKEEANYPLYFIDSAGEKMDGSANNYILRFLPDQLPPVNAFWSLTLYELPSSLLSANPLNRYLINSPMLPDLKKDADGGLTLCIQHESPGKDKESNWLPAPKGSFFCAMRLYWPKKEVLDGKWVSPPMERVDETKEP